MTIEYVPNIVEANGKTIRENNMALDHKIPLGALVEINCDYSDEHGIRMFVCDHNRDCDGTPLYTLWPSKSISSYTANIVGNDEIAQIQRLNNMQAVSGWGDDSLIVIKLP